MKQELNKTINVLSALTNKIIDIKAKTDTLLTLQQFEILNERVNQLQQAINKNTSQQNIQLSYSKIIGYGFNINNASSPGAYDASALLSQASDVFELDTTNGTTTITNDDYRQCVWVSDIGAKIEYKNIDGRTTWFVFDNNGKIITFDTQTEFNFPTHLFPWGNQNTSRWVGNMYITVMRGLHGFIRASDVTDVNNEDIVVAYGLNNTLQKLFVLKYDEMYNGWHYWKSVIDNKQYGLRINPQQMSVWQLYSYSDETGETILATEQSGIINLTQTEIQEAIDILCKGYFSSSNSINQSGYNEYVLIPGKLWN